MKRGLQILDAKALDEIYYQIHVELGGAPPPGHLVVRVSLPRRVVEWLEESSPELRDSIVQGIEVFATKRLSTSGPHSRGSLCVVLSQAQVERVEVTLECVDDCVKSLVGSPKAVGTGLFAIERSDGRGSDWIDARGVPCVPSDAIASMVPDELATGLETLIDCQAISGPAWADGDSHTVAGHRVTYFGGGTR